MTLLLTLFLACGDKDKEETDTSPATEQVEETQPASEETSEEPQDESTSETTEDTTFKTNEQLGVCEDEGENS